MASDVIVFLCLVGVSASFVEGASQAKYNYSEVLGYNILFYDAQRSGKLPANNPIKWRGDSALGDKGEHGEDLTGGWYDAGDHVKFNFPMAATTTTLLLGVIKFEKGYQVAGQLDNFYDMIKWPLDYLLKCWVPSREELYVQVGDGEIDHHYWIRPEDMTMLRPAYKISPKYPGSDVAADTASAFAAGSIAFKTKDPAYSRKLLAEAESLYRYALRYRGLYSVSLGLTYYTSNDYTDELCLASIWLYKATGNSSYLNNAITYHSDKLAWSWSSGDKTLINQFLLYEITKDINYKALVDKYFNYWLPGGTIFYSPCGFAYRDEWGSLRHPMNTGFLAAMAAENPAWSHNATNLLNWVLGQVNYALGDNNKCLSYIVGFGPGYPQRPHHRGASCPSPPAPCNDSALFSPLPNPHVLYGAMVGGPSNQDGYYDSREDYVHNEVAVDYNMGVTGLMAALVQLDSESKLPPPPTPKCPCTKAR